MCSLEVNSNIIYIYIYIRTFYYVFMDMIEFLFYSLVNMIDLQDIGNEYLINTAYNDVDMNDTISLLLLLTLTQFISLVVTMLLRMTIIQIITMTEKLTKKR